MAVGPSDIQDLFKEEFKRHKKNSGTDFIDVRAPEHFSNELTESATVFGESTGSKFGLRSPQEWKLYRLNSIPGLVVVPNPFLPGGQIHWVGRCLIDYPCKPNICNLDAHTVRNGQGRLWPKVTSSVTEDSQASGADTGAGTGAKRVKLSKDEESVSKDSDLYRLRWVTLGYHYDWNTKEYYRDRWSPFPTDLAEMATFILNVCGFPSFSAEAGIVNYYHMDSTLSGHTDHSEKDLSRPLLSLSFGQSAIFLIGGPTKQTRPKALLLNSGDIVIMSGDSRLAYHGVPKILPYHLREGISSDHVSKLGVQGPECLLKRVFEAQSQLYVCGLVKQMDQSDKVETCTSEAEKWGCPSCEELIKTWQLFESYISVSRINVNIRQVISGKCTF